MKKTHFSSPSLAGRAPTLALVSLIRDMTCLSFLGPRRSYYWTSCLLACLEASPGANQGLLIVTQPRLDDPGQSLAGLPVADMEPTRRCLVPVLGDVAAPSLACAASTGLDRRRSHVRSCHYSPTKLRPPCREPVSIPIPAWLPTTGTQPRGNTGSSPRSSWRRCARGSRMKTRVSSRASACRSGGI